MFLECTANKIYRIRNVKGSFTILNNRLSGLLDYFVPETTKLILKKEKVIFLFLKFFLNYSYKWNCPIRFIYHEIIFKDIDTFEKYCN